MALCREARFVIRRQNFRAAQIVFGIHVLLLFRLFLASAFLPRGFRTVLRLLGAALRCPEKQTGAKKNGEAATKRLAQRHLSVHLMLIETGEVSALHFRPISRNNQWRNTTGSEA